MPALYLAIGTRIRQARTRKGLTVNALADMIGISPTFLSRIERGIQAPRPDILRLCAKHLDDHELEMIASALERAPRQASATTEIWWHGEPEPPGEEPDLAVEVARKFGIPQPWVERRSREDQAWVPHMWWFKSPIEPATPKLDELVNRLSTTALTERALADTLLSVIKDELEKRGDTALRDQLIAAVKRHSASAFAAGTRHGVSATLSELKAASSYGLYWALVPFMPPERAAWLHRFHSAVAEAADPDLLQGALLELAQLLAPLPKETLSPLLERLREVAWQSKGAESRDHLGGAHADLGAREDAPRTT